MLAAIGAVLVAISVVVADLLGPIGGEADPGSGHGGPAVLVRAISTAGVEPSGPDELVDLAAAVNNLGGQVSTMLSREREMVADLSHRLRTPLH